MKKIRSEFKGKSEKDLNKEAMRVREEIARLKLELKVSPQKDTNLIFKKRKRLAVILTLLKENKKE